MACATIVLLTPEAAVTPEFSSFLNCKRASKELDRITTTTCLDCGEQVGRRVGRRPDESAKY